MNGPFGMNVSAVWSTGRKLALILSIFLAVLCGGSSTQAAEALLSGELKSLPLRGRPDSPLPMELKLRWNGQHLLEGHIEISAGVFSDEKFVWRSGEVALTNGEQSFRILLPAVSSNGSSWGTHVRFVSNTQTIDLGRFDFVPAGSPGRSFLVGIVAGDGLSNPRSAKIWRSTRIEQFEPTPAPGEQVMLTSAPANLAAADAPDIPLAFCAYDLLIFDADAFAALREKQLDALAKWVEAGGSACVLAGPGLKAVHERLLERLAGQGIYHFENGTIAGTEVLRTFHPGLGRLAVGPESLDFESDGWRDAVLVLWKVQSELRRRVALAAKDGKSMTIEGGIQPPDYSGHSNKWQGPVPPRAYRTQNRFSGNNRQLYNPNLQLNRIEWTGGPWDLYSIFDSLRPASVQVVPMYAIVFLLASFVAVVGPVDYFILGWLKRRKLTWIFFPAVCAAVTIFTIWLAGHYLGRSDVRKSLVISDIGSEGRVVRQNRVELIFTASTRDVISEVHHSLVHVLPWRGGRDESSKTRYEGSLTGHLQISRHAAQWSPIFTRYFGMEGQPRTELHWDRLNAGNLPRDQHSVAVAARLLVDRPVEAICFYHQNDAWCLDKDGDFFAEGRDGIRHELCVHQARGQFSIVSQISPNGGEQADDMAFLDRTDGQQWLVLVVQREADQIFVSRKLYYAE